MPKSIAWIFSIMILSNCTSQSSDSLKSKIQNDSSKFSYTLLGDSFTGDFNKQANGNYHETKTKIEQLRKSFFVRYKHLKPADQHLYLDTVNVHFVNLLINDMIPHWYGTDWDFNGISPNPGSGSIACGYFVSTTLLQMGIKVNRYKLAQQGGTNEAKSLALGVTKNYWRRVRSRYTDIEAMFTNVKDGLYFVGLDNHVGYFYKTNGRYYFLNSDYHLDQVVGSEINESAVFRSKLYVFANISHNRTLMKKWLLSETVKVVQ